MKSKVLISSIFGKISMFKISQKTKSSKINNIMNLDNKEFFNLISKIVSSERKNIKSRRLKSLSEYEELIVHYSLEGYKNSQIAEKITDINPNKIRTENAIKSAKKKILDDLKINALPENSNFQTIKNDLREYIKNKGIEEIGESIIKNIQSNKVLKNKKESDKLIKNIIDTWKKNGHVYSAPCSFFFSGEHAVTYGHPGIYFPLPMRLYLKISENLSSEYIEVENFYTQHPKTREIKNVLHIADYRRELDESNFSNLNNLYSNLLIRFLNPINGIYKYGLKIEILSEFSVACGLNASGALCASLGLALVEHYINIDKFTQYFNIPKSKDITHIISWLLENSFHNNRSSGYGITAAINGRTGRHPLIYFSSKRTRMPYRLSKEGWNPLDVSTGEEAVKNLLNIKTFLLDPAASHKDISSYPEPPKFNVSIVYSGTISKTNIMLSDKSLRNYSSSIRKRVEHENNRISSIFNINEIQNSVRIHNDEIIENVFLNSDLATDNKQVLLYWAYQELLADALGSISIATMNSILSDWKALPGLMNTCQSILDSYGVSNMAINTAMTKLNLGALELQTQGSKSRTQIGMKITGSGGGGNFIALSLLDKKTHRNLIEEFVEDKLTIHFDSTQLLDTDEFWENSVEGVRCDTKN